MEVKNGENNKNFSVSFYPINVEFIYTCCQGIVNFLLKKSWYQGGIRGIIKINGVTFNKRDAMNTASVGLIVFFLTPLWIQLFKHLFPLKITQPLDDAQLKEIRARYNQIYAIMILENLLIFLGAMAVAIALYRQFQYPMIFLLTLPLYCLFINPWILIGLYKVTHSQHDFLNFTIYLNTVYGFNFFKALLTLALYAGLINSCIVVYAFLTYTR
jgi:hypothetical protein